jgi:[ribosomal protein S5]-alanine N-acetyltransferase
MAELATPRLALRPLSAADAPGVQKYFPHWEIVKNLVRSVPWPYPPDGAAQYVAAFLPKIAAGTDMIWSIRLRENPVDAIGIIHLHDLDQPVKTRGFWLAVPYQGRGYMTEAVAAVNGYAFDVMGIDAFIIKTARGNAASARVKEKTGAVLLRVDPAGGHYHGDFSEQETWELTAENWRRHRAGAQEPL